MVSRVEHSKVVSALPEVVQESTLYYVRVGTGFDQYLTGAADLDGNVIAHKMNIPDATEIGSIAGGSTLGLEQSIKAAAGDPALTVLVVGPCTSGKVQGTSLSNGNMVVVYADGTAFNNKEVLHREFMSFGEPICFTGLTVGAIIVATGGFYGFSEVEGKSTTAAQQGIMPLMSFGFSFEVTFLYAFRGSTGATNDRGIITVTNGPLANIIELTDGTGAVTHSQTGIELAAWETVILDTDGNKEYILSGTNKMMACILGEGGGSVGDGLTTISAGMAWDCRLVLPVSEDQIGNPRSGFMSALYNNTAIKAYRQNGNSGSFVVSPGSPVDIATYGGALGDHNPSGYVRFMATGLASGYSGADGQGGDAVQFSDVKTLSQVVAQPLAMPDGGNGDETGITVFSMYTGTAKVYEWDDTNKILVLKYTLYLTRDASITIFSKEDQLYPCAASLSNSSSNTNNTLLVGDLLPGVIVADVPIGVVIQAQNGQTTMRTQDNGTVLSIYTQEDETASYGWTPPTSKVIIKEGADGILYKKVLTGSTAPLAEAVYTQA